MEDEHFYLIGVGGIGMCGVARLLLQRGARVSGSDSGEIGHLKLLKDAGLIVNESHSADHLSSDVSSVVYSAAVDETNVEFVEAKRRGLPLFKYSQMVGRLMSDKLGICVAGTHGKTTTSSMIAWILRSADRNPSFIIGADVPQLGGSSHGGEREFVVESCEYDRSFHNYHPQMAVVTNVDLDHLDYYRDLEEIQESFQKFCSQVTGPVFVNGDDPASQCLISDSAKTFGFSEENYLQIISDSSQQAQFIKNGDKWITVALNVPGKHNLLNAAAASLVAHECGCSDSQIIEALKSYEGAERRFQILSESSSLVIVDDYAHHPVEIAAVIQAVGEKWPSHKCAIVFQPHQRSRTRFLMESFADVLSGVDLCLLPDIYFVRDSDERDRNVSSHDLVKEINDKNGQAIYLESFEEVNDHLKALSKEPTVVLLLGAGDIWKLGKQLCP